eukprot:12819017-Alexandrium_andersonii.AAC.1
MCSGPSPLGALDRSTLRRCSRRLRLRRRDRRSETPPEIQSTRKHTGEATKDFPKASPERAA